MKTSDCEKLPIWVQNKKKFNGDFCLSTKNKCIFVSFCSSQFMLDRVLCYVFSLHMFKLVDINNPYGKVCVSIIEDGNDKRNLGFIRKR